MRMTKSNPIKIKYKPTKVIVYGTKKKERTKSKKRLFKGFSSSQKSFASRVDSASYSIGRKLFKWKSLY